MAHKQLKDWHGTFTELPRGGYIVDTSEGYIQFGSPPETIKDTMVMPKGTPQTYVLAHDHFDPTMGISLAEIEFPTYYNFFLKQRKVIAYVPPKRMDDLRVVFGEAFLGPEHVDVSEEFSGENGHCVPDIKAEMEYFRNGMNIEDVLDIREFPRKGVQIGKVRVIPQDNGEFIVHDGGKKIAEVPRTVRARVHFDLGTTMAEPFVPPDFGITCLGPSHGFDPTQNTSGFLLWVNKNGIMVDPPVNTTEWLRDSNVNPKLIDTVILTHCHADHDAGTFQKILEETRIHVYTTPTVLRSFLTKYSSLTQIPASTLMQMFHYHPVKINQQFNIHGGLFSFHYSLHSIPTFGFYFLYRDRTFLYSSDHMADPEVLADLCERGIMPERRMQWFLTQPWDHDIIYHEAGIPPLHTPVSFLNTLRQEVQKKITVYHIAEEQFPQNTALTLATFGIGDTLYPKIGRHRFEEAYQILDVFSRIDIFPDLPFEKIKYLLLNVRTVEYDKGDVIIHKDAPGDTFFVIVSGAVSVGGLEESSNKTYGTYEYFGEVSLVQGVPRSAEVVAASHVVAYTVDKVSFLRLIENTPVAAYIRRLATMRNSQSWTVLHSNPHFAELSSSQITQLETLLVESKLPQGATLFGPGYRHRYYYILISGRVRRMRGRRSAGLCKPGELIGDPLNRRENRPPRYSYSVLSRAQVFRVLRRDFDQFLSNNPGLLMNMIFEDR